MVDYNWIYFIYVFNHSFSIYGYLHLHVTPMLFFLYMSFFAGLLLMSRLLFVKDNELCDTNNEPLCGKKTCSFSGTRHVAWNVRLRAAGKKWFTPSIGLHFFMWVIPVLTTCQLKPILAMLLTGPYSGILFTQNIHEQPAIWCYTAIGQMLFTYFML